MDLTVQELGGNSLIQARKASELIEQRNISEAKSALVKAGMSVAKHIHEISKLIERYTAVQDFYKREEESLTLKIGDIHLQERDARSQKSSAESSLSLQRNELYRHKRNLESARDRLKSAEIKHTVLTLLTFGATAPLTSGAVTSAEREIRDTKRKINENESEISSLSSTISQLNRDESRYREDRRHLEKEKGRIKAVIAFLIDAETYGNEYSDTAQACSQRTTLVEKVVSTAEKKGYSLFDSSGTERILTSFEEAWEAFEEMNDKGQGYVFTIDFQCSQCNCSCKEFPYVSSGKLICAGCFEEFQ